MAFNAKLGAIASGADANDLLPGIGPISVLGIIHFSRISYCCSDFREETFSLYGEQIVNQLLLTDILHCQLYSTKRVIRYCVFGEFLLKVDVFGFRWPV